MSSRRLSLRVVGLLVAAIILMAATQLLLLSFEVDPLISQSRTDSVNNWIRDRPKPGAGILAGIALAALALWMVWSFVQSFGTDRRVITIRRRGGWTKLDRATLEDSLERQLEGVDRRNDVAVRITRSGRIDAKVTTPDPSVSGPAQELRDVIDDVCETRSLPCRSGRIVTSVPRRMTGRRNVR